MPPVIIEELALRLIKQSKEIPMDILQENGEGRNLKVAEENANIVIELDITRELARKKNPTSKQQQDI